MSSEYGQLPVDIDEYLWLKWLAKNVDFGPAHYDVMLGLQKRYEEETGNTVPEKWREK